MMFIIDHDVDEVGGGGDDGDEDHDSDEANGDDGDDDIYIMMQFCLFVTKNEHFFCWFSWVIKVFYGFSWFLVSFHGFSK